MMRLCLRALVALALLANIARAQAAPLPVAKRTTPVVKVAKWGLLGAAVGLGVFALRRSIAAEDAYDELRALCVDNPGRCAHAGGSYSDTDAERLYDRAQREDRSAQIGIYGGQAALLGSVALFIVDLRGDREPTNIPYPGPRGSARSTHFTIIRVAF
jgi:hypothetical protein